MNLSRILGNASANVARVFVNAVAALLLPRILLGTLSADEYAVWVLIVQIGLYSGYLDVGVSTVVGRMVAYFSEKDEQRQLSYIVSSGLALMVVLAFVACLAIAGVVLSFGTIFPDVPTALQRDAATTLLIVGIVIAVRLPFWVLSGVFVGLQRNEFPLAFAIINKLVTLMAVAVAARLEGGLLAVGVAYALANVVTYVFEAIVYKRCVPQIEISVSSIQWSSVREIGRNSLGFGVWTLSMLLISGLDLLIVGRFDFASVAAYSFAVTLVSLMTQIQSSAVSVTMPLAAILNGRNDNGRLNDLLLSATRYGVLLLYLVGLPLIATSTLIIDLWVGSQYVESTVPLLILLVIAAIIRQSGLSFAMIVVGVGRQNEILLSPILGGTVNLTISVAATIRFGAVGAAIGTIIGGLVEVGLHISYNLPRIRELTLLPRVYFLSGFLIPSLCALPAIAVAFGWLLAGDPVNHPLATAAVGASVGLLMLLFGWFFGIGASERARIPQMFRTTSRPLPPPA